MDETDIVPSRLVARTPRAAGFFSLLISVPLTAISTVLLSASIIRFGDVSLDGLTVAVAFLISIASFIVWCPLSFISSRLALRSEIIVVRVLAVAPVVLFCGTIVLGVVAIL